MEEQGVLQTGSWPISELVEPGSKSRLIKLSLPIKLGFFEEEDAGDQNSDHVCDYCGKKFRSGKALGGHKRIHMQENKINFQQKLKTIRSIDESEEASCCVCRKKFSSMKALYGHMRFHPHRGWKGIQPPPPLLPASSSSTLSDDHQIDSNYDPDSYSDPDSDSFVFSQVDLSQFLKSSWSVTGKRGRRSLKIDAENLEEDMEEAVNDLLMLANAEGKTDETRETNIKPEKTREGNNDLRMIKRKKQKKKVSDTAKNTVIGPFEDKCGNEKHVCVTCNRSFASYQALGGHRAGHNKAKTETLAVSDVVQASPNNTTTGLLSSQGSNTTVCSNRDHQCNICGKSFPTGQALGGHKRRHRVGPTEAASSSTQETKPRMMLDFDLNLVPPPEEEDR